MKQDDLPEIVRLPGIFKRMFTDNQQLDQGWIDNKGQFWPTLEGGHMHFINRVLLIHTATVQKQGWVTVFDSNDYRHKACGDFFQQQSDGHARLNDAQSATLKKIGLDPDNPRRPRQQPISFRDIYPNSFEDHILPQETGEAEREKFL